MKQQFIDAYKPPVLDERTAAKVLQMICEHFNTDEATLRGPARKEAIIKARFVAYWLLYNHAGKNYNAIGRFMQRHHKAVMQGVRQVDFAIKTETFVWQEAGKLKSKMDRWQNHPWKYSNRQIQNFTMKSLLQRKVDKHLAA